MLMTSMRSDIAYSIGDVMKGKAIIYLTSPETNYMVNFKVPVGARISLMIGNPLNTKINGAKLMHLLILLNLMGTLENFLVLAHRSHNKY